MSEETKAPTPPPSGEPKDSAVKPNPPSVEPVPAKKPGDPAAPANPGAPGAPPKAAAPDAPAAPAKPAGPTPEPWNSALVATQASAPQVSLEQPAHLDRKSTRLNSSHVRISHAVF